MTYYEKNKDRIKERQMRYYLNHKEECNERSKAYQKNNREYINEKLRLRYHTDEKYREIRRQYSLGYARKKGKCLSDRSVKCYISEDAEGQYIIKRFNSFGQCAICLGVTVSAILRSEKRNSRTKDKHGVYGRVYIHREKDDVC